MLSKVFHRTSMRILSAALCLLVLIVPALPALANVPALYTNPSTNYKVFIDDQADLLTPEEEEALLPLMQKITAYGGCMLATCDSNYQSAAAYAKDVYYDYFRNDSGTLFLIDMDNRDIILRSNGAISRTITSAYADSITDNSYTYASKKDYYGCAEKTFEQVLTLLEGGRIAQPMKYISLALFSLSAAILINFLMLKSSRNAAQRKDNPAVAQASVTLPKVGAALAGMLLIKSVIHTRSDSSSGGGGGGHSGGGGGGGHSGGSSGGHHF